LLESLKSPVPLDGLALSATAVPFRDAGSQASVAVILQLDPRSLAFTQRDDRFTNVIEVSYLAVDHAGKARVGKREEMTLNLRPETRDHALREGIRIVSRISLPPGRYQLRIGAREANGGRIGSVLYDLDVPNFTAEPLGISGILIASQRTVQIPTPQPDSAFDRELMVQPTTVRVFAADDILRVAAPLHVNGPAARSPVEVETTLNAEDGGVVFRGQETYQGDDATRGYLHVVHIPLIRLVPGTYVIRIGAKARMGVEAPVARELPITVAPQN
jgi:hypothetical protein